MEGQMKLTISNGYGLTVSADFDKDSDINECMEAISKLLYAAGFSLHNIKQGMSDEAERMCAELDTLKE